MSTAMALVQRRAARNRSARRCLLLCDLVIKPFSSRCQFTLCLLQVVNPPQHTLKVALCYLHLENVINHRSCQLPILGIFGIYKNVRGEKIGHGGKTPAGGPMRKSSVINALTIFWVWKNKRVKSHK